MGAKKDYFYESSTWARLRYMAMKRDGFKCLACARDGKSTVLHVDHIKPRSKFPHLELDLNNLQTLCERCNIGKSNEYEDDHTVKVKTVEDIFGLPKRAENKRTIEEIFKK